MSDSKQEEPAAPKILEALRSALQPFAAPQEPVQRLLEKLLPEGPLKLPVTENLSVSIHSARWETRGGGIPEPATTRALTDAVLNALASGGVPYAWMNSFHFGEPSDLRVQAMLTRTVRVCSEHANRIGIATVFEDAVFEKTLRDFSFCESFLLGIHPGSAPPHPPFPGDPLLLIGRPTLPAAGEPEAPPQPSGAFNTRNLLDFFLDRTSEEGGIRPVPVGEGGILLALQRFSRSHSLGASVNVDALGDFSESTSLQSILLSPVGERVLVTVSPNRVEEFVEESRKRNLHCLVIGSLSDPGTIELRRSGTEPILLDTEFGAVTEPASHFPRGEPDYLARVSGYSLSDIPEPTEIAPVILDLASSPNLCSHRWIHERFDWTAGGNVLRGPHGNAAVLALPDTEIKLAVSLRSRGYLCYLDPEIGAQIAMADATKALTCVGARPLGAAVTLHLGDPENTETAWHLDRMGEGIRLALEAFGVILADCIIQFHRKLSGRVFHPVVEVAMLGLIEPSVPPLGRGFIHSGDAVVLLGHNEQNLGGSAYLRRRHGRDTGPCPSVNLGIEQDTQRLCLDAIRNGWVRSAHPVGEGGLAAALAVCASESPEGLGAEVTFREKIRRDMILFGESQGRILLSVPREVLGEFERLAYQKRIACQVLGTVEGSRLLIDRDIEIPLPSLRKKYHEAFEETLQ